MLILKIGNVYTDIEGDINTQSFDSDFIALRHKLSYRPEGYLFSPRYKSRQWDGWKRLAWKNSTRCYFPTGLLSLAKDFFKEKNIEHKILDCRKKPDKNIELDYNDEKYKLRDYQERVVKQSIDKGRGVIMCPTGSGKTVIAAAIIKECGVKPFLFLVTSIDLLEQTHNSFCDVLSHNGSNLKVGKIGGGTVDIQDINIMTVQTAVRALGKKFIRFDSESGKDYISKSLLQKYKKEICELIYNSKGVIADECVSGDTLVRTKKGVIRIDRLYNHIGEDILSFDGNNISWKKITHFYPKGRKEIYKVILLNGGVIKCTKEHLLMTNRGWLPVANICPGDLILCSANVGVDSVSLFQAKDLIDIRDMSAHIGDNRGPRKSGSVFLTKLLQLHHYVNAAVENNLDCTVEPSSHLYQLGDVKDTIDSSTDTTSVQQNGICCCLAQNNPPYLGRFLEIRRFISQRRGVRIQDFPVTTDFVNQNGQNSNQTISAGWQLSTGNTKTGDTETEQHHSELAVILNFCEFITLLIAQIKNESQSPFSMLLDKSVLHGGFVMTEAGGRAISGYIPKVFQKTKFASRLPGFQANTDQLPFMNPKVVTTTFISEKKQGKKLSQKLETTSQTACDTNYVAVESIVSCGEENVFDITVEDTHCFFANDILVHNCQHWRADMCQLVTNSMKKAYYKFAASGTPYRDQGDDLLIQACFGKKICSVTASELILDKYLVAPNITFVHINPPSSKFKNWQNIYKERIVEDEYYNTLIANITEEYLKSGKHVLVLVQQIEHGKTLESMIDGSLFVYGNSPKKERISALDKMRKGYIKCIVSSVIFDEGIDLKMLDTLILAGGGKSPTRAMQRIGRVLRPFENKTEATVVDFFVHEKYLEEHAKAREKMYRTEPEFKIKHLFVD